MYFHSCRENPRLHQHLPTCSPPCLTRIHEQGDEGGYVGRLTSASPKNTWPLRSGPHPDPSREERRCDSSEEEQKTAPAAASPPSLRCNAALARHSGGAAAAAAMAASRERFWGSAPGKFLGFSAGPFPGTKQRHGHSTIESPSLQRAVLTRHSNDRVLEPQKNISVCI